MNPLVTSVLASLATVGTIMAVLSFLGAKLTTILSDRYLRGAETRLKTKADQELARVQNELVRSADLYRAQLRKSEWIYQKEYEASAKLSALYRNFYPTRLHPAAEWEDALELIMEDASKTEERLKGFLNEHAPALTVEEVAAVDRCINLANEIYTTDGYAPEHERVVEAEKLFDAFKAVHMALHERVRTQSAA